MDDEMLRDILNQHLKVSYYLALFISGILCKSATGAWLNGIIYITDVVGNIKKIIESMV